MPLSDYSHWNEDARYIWWHEEGKHTEEPQEDYEDDMRRSDDAQQAFAEQCAEDTTEHLKELLADEQYLRLYPHAKEIIEWELKNERLEE